MALSELETLTYKLNETKRDSEGRYDAHRVLCSLGRGRSSSITSSSGSVSGGGGERYMVQQLDMTQVVS